MNHERGFTLTEMLVAVSLLAALALLLLPALRGLVRGEVRLTEAAVTAERLASAEDALREILSRSYRPPQGANELGFLGQPTGFRVLTRPEGIGRPVRAAVQLDEGVLQIAIRELSRSSADPSVTPERRVSIALGSGRFWYFGRSSPERPPGWVAQWQGAYPPQLVALVVDRPSGERLRIEIPVNGQGRFDCVFDSGQGLCLAEGE